MTSAMVIFPSLELSRLTKLDASELRLLWVNDWHDGPLEALVEHAGAPCLMVLHHHDLSSDRPYKWILFQLTPEQLADQKKWHALYAEHVGEHWCFHGTSVVRHEAPAAPADPDRFHALHEKRAEVDLTRNAAVGWTDEVPLR